LHASAHHSALDSLLDQFATDIVLPFPPMMLRIVRVARILRIMRLLKGTLMATDGH
jgi:hypothetical protein